MDLDGGIRAGPQLHPPGQGSLGAESLPVDEVGPPANDLAQQQTHDRQVRHGGEADLLQPCKDQGHNDAGDDSAVDGQPPIPNSDDPSPVQASVSGSVQVQVKDHVVNAGPQDAAGHRPQHEVQHVVLRQAEALGPLHAQKQARQHTEGQNDPIPVDAMADMDGDGVGVEFPVAEQAGKADGHILQSAQNRFFLSFSWKLKPLWARSH